jgi:hypothetical protein
MAFDVSALASYTKDNEDSLVIASIFGAKTQQLIQSEGTIMADVKSAEQINQLSTDAIFQAGGTCGFTSSGTTTFTRRALTVGKFKVNESLCPKSLEAKYTQLKLKAGSRPQDVNFFQTAYTGSKASVIAAQLETATWQGDTASGNVNLNKFDGFIKLIDASGSATAANTATWVTGGQVTNAGGGFKESNVYDAVNAMWKALPKNIMGKNDIRVFVGWDIFNLYISKLTALNLFAYTAKGSEVSEDGGEIIIPGTNYKLTAVHGLTGTNRMFSMRTSNMYLGCDILGEEDRWEIFYAKEADEVRFVSEWKLGVQVAFPNEIVQFTLA